MEMKKERLELEKKNMPSTVSTGAGQMDLWEEQLSELRKAETSAKQNFNMSNLEHGKYFKGKRNLINHRHDFARAEGHRSMFFLRKLIPSCCFLTLNLILS